MVFASAGADGIIRVWDVNTYELIKTLRGHTEGVNSIAFNEQGDLLASGSVQEGALRIWGFPSE
jgi:WD40 repeat protein